MPALRATRIALGEAMKAGGRGLTADRQRFGLRRVLVISQVAFSLALIVVALLFTRSLRNLLTVDLGFQRTGILVTNLDFTQLHLEARYLTFKQELLQRKLVESHRLAAGLGPITSQEFLVQLGEPGFLQNDGNSAARGAWLQRS
jgi:hypothetical protein